MQPDLYLEYQNVFLNFSLVWPYPWGMEQAKIKGKTPLAVEAGKIFSIALGCMAALLIQSDYDYIGIIIIAAFYEFHESRSGRSLASSPSWRSGDTGFKLWCRSAGSNTDLGSITEKGQAAVLNILFYWFYPVHLVVLVVGQRVFPGIFSSVTVTEILH